MFNNLSNPVQFICSAIGGIETVTAPETAKLCAEYLGPGLRLLNANFANLATLFAPVPLLFMTAPFNPYLMKSMDPQDIVYSEARLAPAVRGRSLRRPRFLLPCRLIPG